jgi:hypothetical protein
MTDFDFFQKKRDYDLILINHSQNQSKIRLNFLVLTTLNNSNNSKRNALVALHTRFAHEPSEI